MSIPCTSTPSERAFSDIGVIYNEERANLDIDTVEKLVFLRENWEWIPKDLGKKLKIYCSKNNIEI